MRKVREGMVLAIEVTKLEDVYFKLAKYMFRVKLTLFSSREKSEYFLVAGKANLSSISFHACRFEEKVISYPSRERKNISINNARVNFGLAFLQGNKHERHL